MRQGHTTDGSRVRAALALVAVVASALVLAVTQAGEQAHGAEAAAGSSTPLAHTFSSDATSRAGWSRARMASAADPTPLGRGVDGAADTGAPGSGEPAAGIARSKRIRNTTRYPNRTHGRTFFRSGGRDYSCSATVISTGAGNTIVTAAHCVFDRGTGDFVNQLVFVPGYRAGSAPFGAWRATHAAVPGGWAVSGAADLDTALVQLDRKDGRGVQQVVGSRGIGFKQPVKGRLHAFGYPAAPDPYDGEQLVRCGSRAKRDPFHRGSIGLRCDMESGASGGGWVAQKTFLIANTSHGHSARGVFFGPRFGRPVKKLYGFKDKGSFPSVDPVRCGGRIATIVGTDAAEKIKGSKKNDVIATLGGDDVVIGKGGRDRICAGKGDDAVRAGGGRDRIEAGRGTDRCDGGGGRDRADGCERERRVP